MFIFETNSVLVYGLCVFGYCFLSERTSDRRMAIPERTFIVSMKIEQYWFNIRAEETSNESIQEFFSKFISR